MCFSIDFDVWENEWISLDRWRRKKNGNSTNNYQSKQQ